MRAARAAHLLYQICLIIDRKIWGMEAALRRSAIGNRRSFARPWLCGRGVQQGGTGCATPSEKRVEREERIAETSALAISELERRPRFPSLYRARIASASFIVSILLLTVIDNSIWDAILNLQGVLGLVGSQ